MVRESFGRSREMSGIYESLYFVGVINEGLDNSKIEI